MARVIHASASDSLQRIFDEAPAGAVICLAPGEYRQKVMIRTPDLTIRGAGADRTKLVFGDYARMRDNLGAEWNTFRTYTLAVCADGVSMSELTVENDAGSPEKLGQEVALSVCADRFRMERCRLRSTQDTLFLGPLPSDLIGRYEGFLLDPLRRGGPLRQHFADCLIEGSVDFIFGRGEAVFDRCEIRSVGDARHMGYAAAPAHELHQNCGFLFQECRFTREEAVADGSVFLARPWRDHALAEFRQCVYGPHIAAAGFDPWSGTRRDLTARFMETPEVPGRVAWVNRHAR